MTCLIDLDGTILNFWERYYSIFNESFINGLLRTNKLPDKYEYILMRREGMSEKMILNLIGITNTEKYLNYRMEKLIESNHYLSFDKLFDIKRLEKFDHRILITYRKNHKNLINQLKKLGIHDFFDKIITPENIFHSAIPVNIFKLEMMGKYKEENCIVIGDTKIDILSAKANGIYSIGVLSGMTNLARMENINPDRIINNISEL